MSFTISQNCPPGLSVPRISVLKGRVQDSEKQLLTLVVQDRVILYFSGKRSMSYQEEYQEVVLYEAILALCSELLL